MPSPAIPEITVNMGGMADRYLSQHDIARLLGVGRTMINVWRNRHEDFPAPDVQVGLGLDKPGIPGWHPERMDEIREWVAARSHKLRRGRDK